MTNYVFDVDGTLTPSRGRMDEAFKKFFLKFIEENTVYLVTGSDYYKTVEQVGADICKAVEKCFNCSGNSIWKNGKQIETTDWKIPGEAVGWMRMKLNESSFKLRTGNHIEERPGLVNFSTIGRGANTEQRKLYVEFDQENREREILAKEFNDLFTSITAQVAGETGLDIIPAGKDKRQVAKMVDGPIIFFGDKMEYGGNDYPLKFAIEGRKDSAGIKVRDWQQTQKYLQQIQIKDVHEYEGMV